MPRINIAFEDKELAELRKIAKDNGFVLDRGTKKGEGSVSQLVHAIANWQYKVVPVCEVPDCHNQVAIKAYKKSDDHVISNVCWVHMDELHAIHDYKKNLFIAEIEE
jgi:hypothetical protein